MVDLLDMDSCQAYGHIMLGLEGGGGEWFDWQLYEMPGKHPRGCSALSLPCLLFLRLFVTLFVAVAFLLPLLGYPFCWLRYWQNVLLVIVCLMDQTILIEFNYIACALPLSLSRWLLSLLSQLLLVLVICNNFELLPRHSSLSYVKYAVVMVCWFVRMSWPSRASTKQVCVPLCVFWG